MNDLNPAWKTLLDVLPQEFHTKVIPVLQDLDARFASNAEELKKYEAYKPLAEAGVPMDRIAETLRFAKELEDNPQEVFTRMNTLWELGFVPAEEAAKLAAPPADDSIEDWDGVDIQNHPLIKQLSDQLTQVQQNFEQRTQAEQEAAELAEFERHVDSILEKDENKGVPRPLVMAYMAQGYDGPQAVAEVKSYLAGGVQVPTPPTTDKPPSLSLMGGDGAAGSGIPTDNIKVGHDVKGGQVNDLVVALLESQAQANAQG